MRRVSFTDQQKAEMRRLRQENWTYQAIADHFRTGTTNIYRIVNDSPPQKYMPPKKGQRVTLAEARAAFARLPRYDLRSLTGMICGDPLPERSALAQRTAHA